MLTWICVPETQKLSLCFPHTVALKRALKANSNASKAGSRRGKKASYGSRGSRTGSRTGSKVSSDDQSPAGSVGNGSLDGSDPDGVEADPELGSASDDEESRESESKDSRENCGNRSGSQGLSGRKSNNQSLGFLAEDFGRPSKWGLLFPWMRQNDFTSRFKEAIFNTGGASTVQTKSWHAQLFPCCNAQVNFVLLVCSVISMPWIQPQCPIPCLRRSDGNRNLFQRCGSLRVFGTQISRLCLVQSFQVRMTQCL